LYGIYGEAIKEIGVGTALRLLRRKKDGLFLDGSILDSDFARKRTENHGEVRQKSTRQKEGGAASYSSMSSGREREGEVDHTYGKKLTN